ncbi:MAG TPA: hypothetical protein VGD93_03160, partial [Devosia sp.]
MADNDDKRGDDASAGGKKTLTLKGAPNLGGRPGVSRSSRTVVVEKRTRVVRPGAPGFGTGAAPRPHPSQPQSAPQQRQPFRGPPPSVRTSTGLTSSENDARQRVLREAAARAAADNERFAQEEARRIEEEKRRREIREQAEREEAARAQAKADEAAAVVTPEQAPAPAA